MNGARAARAAWRDDPSLRCSGPCRGRVRRQFATLGVIAPLAWLPLAPALATAGDLAFEPVLAAIQQVESAGRPWVIRDNTTGQSFDLASRQQAEATARARLQLGHSLDLGLYQINSVHLRRPGVDLATIFDTAVQQDLARTILAEFLSRARALYGDTRLAWERAIGAYNDGHVDSENEPYVARVLRVLGRVPLTRPAGLPGDILARDPSESAAPTLAGYAAQPAFAFAGGDGAFEAAARVPGADLPDGDRALFVLLAVVVALVVLAGGIGTAVLLRGAALAALGAAHALARPPVRPRSARQSPGFAGVAQ